MEGREAQIERRYLQAELSTIAAQLLDLEADELVARWPLLEDAVRRLSVAVGPPSWCARSLSVPGPRQDL